MKTFRRWFFGFLLVGLFLQVAHGQQPVRVTDAEATEHLIRHDDPVYPPIAKAARVQGTVVLKVEVDGTGKVRHIASVAGNAMLMQTAISAVKDWTWRPFDEAHGAPVVFEVKVPFGTELTEDQEKAKLDLEVGKEYFPLDGACRDALRVPGDGAIAPCRKEVAVSTRFPWQEQRHLEILDAHENLGRALLNAGMAKEAIEEFDLAIQIAEQSMKKSDAEYAYPLLWRATAERQVANNDAALKDYASAEESMRLAIKNLPDMTKQYGFALKRMLQQHAALLTAMGRDQEGQSLLSEANTL
jgi:TonB family protein